MLYLVRSVLGQGHTSVGVVWPYDDAVRSIMLRSGADAPVVREALRLLSSGATVVTIEGDGQSTHHDVRVVPV
jgi:hypothetical protein